MLKCRKWCIEVEWIFAHRASSEQTRPRSSISDKSFPEQSRSTHSSHPIFEPPVTLAASAITPSWRTDRRIWPMTLTTWAVYNPHVWGRLHRPTLLPGPSDAMLGLSAIFPTSAGCRDARRALNEPLRKNAARLASDPSDTGPPRRPESEHQSSVRVRAERVRNAAGASLRHTATWPTGQTCRWGTEPNWTDGAAEWQQLISDGVWLVLFFFHAQWGIFLHYFFRGQLASRDALAHIHMIS